MPIIKKENSNVASLHNTNGLKLHLNLNIFYVFEESSFNTRFFKFANNHASTNDKQLLFYYDSPTKTRGRYLKIVSSNQYPSSLQLEIPIKITKKLIKNTIFPFFNKTMGKWQAIKSGTILGDFKKFTSKQIFP